MGEMTGLMTALQSIKNLPDCVLNVSIGRGGLRIHLTHQKFIEMFGKRDYSREPSTSEYVNAFIYEHQVGDTLYLAIELDSDEVAA